MKYVESQYNIVINKNEEFVYLYNSYYGSYAKIEKEIYDLIHGIEIDETAKIECFDVLKKEGFIKPIALNEFNRILLREKSEIYSRSKEKLTIVIAPTMACNLECEYCFEKTYRNNSKLLKDDIDKIIKFIHSRITKNTRELHVTWFGGEPLLEYDFILLFSERLKSHLKEYLKGIEYSSSIITNGTLLSKNNIQKLVDICSIKSFQITIDGTIDNYCRIKKATISQFNTLIETIGYLTNLARVNIRLNSNKINYEDLKEVTKLIVDHCSDLNNIDFYLAKIIDYETKCENCNSCNFTQEEYDIKKIEFKKFYLGLINKKYKISIPKYRGCFCGLFTMNNFVIGPGLEIYKCEHDVGVKEKSIGNINYGIYYNEFMIDFLENKHLDKCRNCQLFPICLGGCPSQKISLPEGNSCYYSENFVREILKQWIN